MDTGHSKQSMSHPSTEVTLAMSLNSISGLVNNEVTNGHVAQNDPELEETAKPDGGWGWVVCFSCFLVHVLADGIFYSFGVIYVELLLYFGQGKGETAWISSLANGMCFLSGPLSAVLTDLFGCRRVAIVGAFILSGSLVISSFAPNIYFLFFSFGILAGTGYGLVYLPSIVCVTTYFRKRRALATGIGVSGSGVGTFIFGNTATYFINQYGWRGTMLLFGGISLNCIICALSFLPLPADKTIKDVPNSKSFREIMWDNIKVSIDPSLFKNIPFTIFVISTMLYSFGYYIPYIFLPDTARHIGLSESQGAWLIATIGITNTTGRVIFGAIADRKGINRLVMYSCALVTSGVATSLEPFLVSFPTLLLYAVIFGFSSGVTISLTSVLIADLVGIQKLAGAFGIINFFSGISIVAGPPFVGWLFDVTRSYHLTYLVAGLAISVSGAILFIIPCLRYGKRPRDQK